MNEEMNIKKIVQQKTFRNPDFHNDRNKMIELINTINKQEIDEDTFKMMRIIIRFFRFPVLVLFRPLYKRIELEKEKYLYKSQSQLIKTAGLVRAIIKQYNYSSLQFYFKAGQIQNTVELKEDSNQEPFKRFILDADEKLNHRVLSDPLNEKKRLKNIEDYLKKGLTAASIQQHLCIQQYLNFISFRRDQIQKEIQKQSQKQLISIKLNQQIIVPNKQKQASILINGPQQKTVQDKVANQYLCCRPYFYQNEIINEPETLVQEYKNYEYPFDRFLGDILLKTICGFLNTRGGIIYIGIKEVNDTKKRILVGQKYSENAKQDVLKYFRVLCEKISPEIVNLNLYKLEFVPLKNPVKKNEWVPGKYIIRLRVDMGNQKELYSYRKSDGDELFAFRTENEVLTKRIGQQILQIYRRRLTTNEEKVTYIKHSGPCKPPEMGYQLCIADSSLNKIDLPWINKPGQPNNRCNLRKDKQESNLQPFLKTVFYCLPKDLHDDLKKFTHWNAKSLNVFIQPRDQIQQNCLQIIIKKHNLKDKIKKISRLIQINSVTMTDIEKVLSTILYTEFSESRIGLKNYDEVLNAIDLLNHSGIDYHFIYCSKSYY